MRAKPLLAAAAVISVLSVSLPAQTAQRWISTWGTAQQQARIVAAQPAAALPVTAGGRGQAAPAAAPVPPPAPGAPARRFGVPPPLANVTDQTIRMIVRTSVGGTRVRVRLSNAFGAATVSIGAAHVALRRSESSIVPGSDRALTFSGKPFASMYAGQTLLSDPVTLTIPPLTDLAISLHVQGDAGAPTSHTFGLRPTYISGPGDYTAAASIENVVSTMQSYYWLTGVDVLAAADAGTLVTFGDSITDGDQSTPDTNGMWPARLAARLQANAATKNIGVVNAGIAGNRVLGDNNSGLARFQRDVLSVPGVKWVTVLEGINDIAAATRPPAASTPGGAPAPPSEFDHDDLIAAYRQMIELAHLHGIKVIGCTMTPFGGSRGFTDRGEAIREAANHWIRTAGAFDAVIDFDAATRDRTDPHRFRPEADSPDLLHPGDGGYKLMADAIPLAIFRPR